MKPPHGGPRKGSGRKPGSGKGRTVQSRTITLKGPLWTRLDHLRGDMTRSAWIAAQINKAKP